MKFNLKTLALLLGGGLLGLTSCSNDTLTGDPAGGPEYAGKKVYFTAALALPSDTGTRSATDDEDAEHAADGNNQTNSNADPDYEYGYDYENDVRTMILVFATKTDNKYICAAEVSGIEKAPTGLNYSFEVLAEIDYNDLSAAYSANLFTTAQEVNVYAYCNYTQRLKELFFGTSGTSGTGKPVAGTTEWADFAGEVIEASSAAGESPAISNTIWAPRSFLMTNHAITTTKFPDEIGKWDAYADQSNPFKVTANGDQETTDALLPIYVERVAARIDFRDGSKGSSGGTNNNTYPIITDVHKLVTSPSNSQDKDEKNLFSIQLTRMGLVNMSKKFFYLRRVSANGLNTGATVGGVETSSLGATPYIVDTDADTKNTKGIKANNAETYFNFCLYNKVDGSYGMDQWFVDDIKDVLDDTQTSDKWTGTNGGQYKIWRYVTENTIPGADNQITAQSTGIVFKGRIIAGTDVDEKYSSNDQSAAGEYYLSEKVREALKKVSNTYTGNGDDLPMLFSFDGFLYGGWEELVNAAVIDGTGGTLYTAMNSILGNWKLDSSGKYTTTGNGAQLTVDEAAKIIQTEGQTLSQRIDISDESLRTYAADNNITVYVADNDDNKGWGYNCYYFYWIRHNDNNKSGLMGPMEFATVRNNIYKLYVDSINRLGHPRVKSDDPDPEDEDDPDEKPTRYIQVNIDVLPWVVRENKITF